MDSKIQQRGRFMPPATSTAAAVFAVGDVYQLELKFLSWFTQFWLTYRAGRWDRPGSLVREQLERASLSALLNTAEGNGRQQGRQRAKFSEDPRLCGEIASLVPSLTIELRAN